MEGEQQKENEDEVWARAEASMLVNGHNNQELASSTL